MRTCWLRPHLRYLNWGTLSSFFLVHQPWIWFHLVYEIWLFRDRLRDKLICWERSRYNCKNYTQFYTLLHNFMNLWFHTTCSTSPVTKIKTMFTDDTRHVSRQKSLFQANANWKVLFQVKLGGSSWCKSSQNFQGRGKFHFNFRHFEKENQHSGKVWQMHGGLKNTKTNAQFLVKEYLYTYLLYFSRKF